MADMEFTADFSDLHTLNRLLDSEIPKSAQQSASVFETQFSRVEKQLRLSSQASEAFYKKTLGIEKSVKSARQSYSAFLPLLKEQEKQEKAVARAMDQHSAEVESLRMKYDTAYRAQKQYDAGLDEVRMAHYAGAISAERMAQEIEEIGIQYERVKKGQGQWTNQFVTNSAIAGKSMNKFGMYAQQVGYQVGDFFVQVQSGANVFVAFGQQATQLAGLLPGVAGAVAGIGISVGTMFLAMWDRSKKAEEGIVSFKDAMKSLKEETASASDVIFAFNRNLVDASEAPIQRLIDAQKEVINNIEEYMVINGSTAPEITALEREKEKLATLEGQLEKKREAVSTEDKHNYLLETANMFLTNQQEIRARNGALMEEALSQSEAFVAAQDNYLEKLYQQNDLLQTSVRYGADSVEYLRLKQDYELQNLSAKLMQEAAANGLTEAERQSIQAIIDATMENQNLERGIFRASEYAEALRATVSEIDFSRSIGGASALLGKLGAAYQAAVKIAKVTSEIADARANGFSFGDDVPKSGGTQDAFWSGALDFTNMEGIPDHWMTGVSGASKKKSGGSSKKTRDDGYSKSLEALVESFRNEREELEAWYEEKNLILEDQRAKEILGVEEHNQLKERLEAEHQNRLRALQIAEWGITAGAVTGILDGLAGIMDTENKKQFEAKKKFAISSALISGSLAAVEAWQKGMSVGGPTLAAAYATASALKTAGQIKGISSQSYGSTSSSGSSGGGSGSIATTSTASTAPQQVLIQGLTPGMRLTPEELQTMFDQIYEENDRRGTVFTIAGV